MGSKSIETVVEGMEETHRVNSLRPAAKECWMTRGFVFPDSARVLIHPVRPELDLGCAYRRWRVPQHFHSLTYVFVKEFFGIDIEPGGCVRLNFEVGVVVESNEE